VQVSSPRTILLLVAVLSAIASAAAVGLIVIDPVFPQPEARPPNSFDPHDAYFVGTEQSVLSWSKVYSTLPNRSQEAFLRLATSRVFAASNLGLGGSPAPQGAAFRTLLQAPNAAEVFFDLVKSGQPYSQLYGLAGLFALDQERFRKVSRRFRFSRAKVWTWTGCVISEKKVPIVISEFSDGIWVEALSHQQ
jgi:hypothetical protein